MTSATNRPARVGVITDQTGALSFMGTANVNVAKMVIDDINAGGGLLGRPIELFVEDSATDAELARLLEPRAPRPDLRLSAVRKFNDTGLRAGVAIAPVLPGITDSPKQLDALVKAAAEAKARNAFCLGDIERALRPAGAVTMSSNCGEIHSTYYAARRIV